MSKERVYYDDKREYLEARGVMVTPKNSRPIRLRDSLKEFEVSVIKENSNNIYHFFVIIIIIDIIMKKIFKAL